MSVHSFLQKLDCAAKIWLTAQAAHNEINGVPGFAMSRSTRDRETIHFSQFFSVISNKLAALAVRVIVARNSFSSPTTLLSYYSYGFDGILQQPSKKVTKNEQKP